MSKKYIYIIIIAFLLGLSLSYKMFYSPCQETAVSTSCGSGLLNEFRLEKTFPEFKIESL